MASPWVILGLMKLSKFTKTPLYASDVVLGGYPYAKWMVEDVEKGMDCRVWGCYAIRSGPVIAGFTCNQGAGIHIRDEILDWEDLACKLIQQLEISSPDAVVQRYGITAVDAEHPYDTLTELAKKRGFLAGRNEYDTLRMARTLLDEFRGGKLGRITLELPPEA